MESAEVVLLVYKILDNRNHRNSFKLALPTWNTKATTLHLSVMRRSGVLNGKERRESAIRYFLIRISVVTFGSGGDESH